MAERILCRNRKYRIEVKESDDGYLLVKSLRFAQEGIIVKSRWFAHLQESYWFFGRSWRTIGITNVGYQLVEWKKEYFPELYENSTRKE